MTTAILDLVKPAKLHGIATCDGSFGTAGSVAAVTVIWKQAFTVPPAWQLESVSIKLFTAGGIVSMAAVDGS